MQLKGIILGDQTFDSNEFGSDSFINAINKKLDEGKINKEIKQGIGIITRYSPEKELNLSEIVEVARAIVTLQAKALTHGKFDTTKISELDAEDTTNVITFNQSLEELHDKIGDILETTPEDTYEITLISTIQGTNYGIFKAEEGGNATFYVTDKKEDGIASGYIVDSNGESISDLGQNQKTYCLIQVARDVEIWSGTLDEGFIKNLTIKNIEAESIDVLHDDIIGIIDEGIFTLKNIHTNNELLSMSMKDFSGFADSGKPIDVYFENGKYLFIYKGFNDNGEIAYIATDDDLDEECYSSRYPIYPVITSNDIYLTMYSSDANLYALTTMEKIMVGTIVSYVDDNENHFIGGNFPEYVTNPKGISQLRFIYYIENEEGKKEYDMGYIYCGIETDDNPKGDTKPKQINLFTAAPLNEKAI